MSAAAVPALDRRLVLADTIPGARVRDAVLVVSGALLVAILAQVAIFVPGTPVPITGQTLGVGLVGATLGMNRGALSLTLYALLGLMLPFYSDGGSGTEVLFGANGGYIFGFILAAAAIGYLAERGADRKVLAAFAAFVIAQLLIFGLGVPVLKMVLDMTWAQAISAGFTPFILGGLVKAAVGAALLPSAWVAVRRFERRD